MKPVMQTRFDEGANALDACVASILELPLERVPHFTGEGAGWMVALDSFTRHFGMAVVVIESRALRYICWPSDVLCIASGHTIHGKMHSVVYLGDKLVHDPNPSGCGLTGEPLSFTLFVLTNPARATWSNAKAQLGKA